MISVTKRFEIVIRIFKEMWLNYKFQYPNEIADISLIADIIAKEIKENA